MGEQPVQQPTSDDPVAWARYFWQLREFDGAADRFLAMSALLRYQRLVLLQMESALKALELNPTDYMLLTTLEFTGDRTRLVGALARTLMVHATTATLAVDRLEARGLLVRAAHPTDRRAITVSLTEKGSALVRRASALLQSVDFGLTASADDDVVALTTALTRLREAAGDTARS